MDPEATLKAAKEALDEGDRESADEFLGYYRSWRARGGFEPADGDARFRAMLRTVEGAGAPRRMRR